LSLNKFKINHIIKIKGEIKMFNFKKVVLPAFLAASILVPGVVSAQATSSTADSTSTSTVKVHHKGCKEGERDKLDLKTLEKYVPGATAQLKPIFAQRKDLSKQLKTSINSKIGVDTSFMKDFETIVQDTQSKVKSGAMTKDEAKQYLKQQRQQFEKDHATQIAQVKAAKKNYFESHKDEITAQKQAMKQQMTQTRDSRKALETALKAGDATKIKTAFDSYVSNLNAGNNLLQTQINNLK
jgi:phosphopantetheinyl transferase (holo-ACP synthase)